MNFLAHLYLSREDQDLMFGGLLGDFLRGRKALEPLPAGVRTGVLLHRHIDRITDGMPAVKRLLESMSPPYRRYGGIIIDLAFDHELARRWDDHADLTLEAFDREIRDVFRLHRDLAPPRLVAFMRYADGRGLFAAYRKESEILRSLAGIGQRLSRPNPLHRVEEVWPQMRPACAAAFHTCFPEIQSRVADWLNTRSTSTGS